MRDATIRPDAPSGTPAVARDTVAQGTPAQGTPAQGTLAGGTGPADAGNDYRMLVEGSLQGILIHQGMEVLFANGAYLSMFGYADLPALQAATLRAVIPAEALPEAKRVWTALEDGLTPPAVRAVPNLHRDGSILYVDVLARRILWHGRSAVQATVIDVSDHVRLTDAQAEMERAVAAAVAREREASALERVAEVERANAALRRVNATLAAGGDVPALLGRILAEACTLVGAAGGTAFALAGEGTALRLVGAHVGGCFVAEIPDFPYGGDRLMPVGDPAWWGLLGQGQRPVWIPVDEGLALRLSPGALDWHRARGHGAVLVAPMPLAERAVGLLCLSFLDREEPPPAALEMVNALAQQATLALELGRLAERAREAAVMEERNRLAREMHDTLAQGYTAILMNLKLVMREKGRLSLRAASTLDTLEEVAQENLIAARRSFRALRPQALEQQGFAGAVQALASQVERANGPPVHLVVEAALTFPPAIEAEIYRIVQEALTNAVRHAQSRRILITLAQGDGGRARITVADEGRGFPLSARPAGFGILGMRERAAGCGADLTIDSHPTSGTTVTVVWPAAPGPVAGG